MPRANPVIATVAVTAPPVPTLSGRIWAAMSVGAGADAVLVGSGRGVGADVGGVVGVVLGAATAVAVLLGSGVFGSTVAVADENVGVGTTVRGCAVGAVATPACPPHPVNAPRSRQA